jgi:hypothetical protein
MTTPNDIGSEGNPIKVHVIKDDTKSRPSRPDRTSTFRTIQTVTGQTDAILNNAPNRIEAIISVLGVVGQQANIALCDSQSAANGASGTSGEGQGQVLQPGLSIRPHNTDDMWYAVLSSSYPVPATPSTPATGVAVQNVNNYPVQVVIGANGGTITNVSVNGITVGTAAGTYVVPAYGSISIAYTVATPTMAWTNANGVGALPAPQISVHAIYERA